MEINFCIVLLFLCRFVTLGFGKSHHDSLLECIPTGEPTADVEIIKSDHDEKEYKYMALENKLRVLLVSDPSVEMAGAAAVFRSGYANDPVSVPGLAHFCEHMLFMGTEKYPDENDFFTFLSQNGGMTNAGTGEAITGYFFNVKSESLEPALDRFSQFFIAPLFKPNATERELHAVEQEHQKNYREDSWRIEYIDKSGARKGHPYGYFGSGNFETLKTIPHEKNIDLRKMLLSFYEKHYSSNIMTLAVVGKESLKKLEEMVVPMFSKVKNRNTKLDTYLPPYGKAELATMLKIPTIKEMNELEIKFQLPDLRCFYESKPLRYFSHVIGQKGKGSLSSHLKESGLAREMRTREEPGWMMGLIGFEFFVITIELTEKGLERVDDIITLLFQYLEMMKNTMPQKWIHDEMRSLDHTQFMFQDKKDSTHDAVILAVNLQKYEARHVISGDFVTGDFMREKVLELFKYFTPENFRYLIASNTFNGPWNKRSKYYDVDYFQQKIPKWKIMKWKNVTQFHLPLKNPFIPDPNDLKIVVPRNNQPIKNVPVIIRDNEMVRVWHKADDTFYLPKTVMTITIYSPSASSTPSNLNRMHLFVDLLKETSESLGHSAELAGLYYSIGSTYTGIKIYITGFSSKQELLLGRILRHIVSLKHTLKQEKFQMAKHKLLERLHNEQVQVPYELVYNLQEYVTSETSWSSNDRLQSMNQLTMDSLKHYIDTFLQNIYIEGEFSGNILRSKALSAFNIVEDILLKENGATPMLPTQHWRSREFELIEGKNYLFEKRSTVHKPSALNIYFQVGMQSERNNVVCELVHQMIESKFFDVLRTKEQLGYIVYSLLTKSHSVVGIEFIVQSDKQPSYVNKRIGKFLIGFKSHLHNMSDASFHDYVEATAVKKLDKPKRLSREAGIYSSEIEHRQYHFRRAEKEVEFLRKLNKKDAIQFFEQHLDPESNRRKKLAVVVLGKNAMSLREDTHTNWTVIDDILEFKSSHPLYGHMQPYNNITLLSHKKRANENRRLKHDLRKKA